MKESTYPVAIVTGAAGGLGRATARALAEQGADVVVNDLPGQESCASETLADVAATGRRAVFVPADVGTPEGVEGLFSRALAEFHRLDYLVNNVGTSQPKDIFGITLEDWERVIRINLTSCFLCSQAAMRIMAERKSGRIVNIGSVVGQQGALFGHLHYGTSKAGIFGLTMTLARTAAPLGITVNAVSPGCIETERWYEVLGPDRTAALRSSIPLGLGTPRDVGLAVAFLCGEGGRYITGATIDVNGGLYMR
jgi:NAD(P)-dependent dehydrogenase (short-subunit alcohol dehydrogenase family)